MKKNLVFDFVIILIVLLGAAYFAFKKPIKMGLDLKGGVYVVMEAVAEDGGTITSNDMDRLIEVLERRVNGFGVSEAVVQKTGDKRVIIELPGIKDTQKAVETIGKTAFLEFKLVESDGSLTETGVNGKDLKQADISYDNFGRPQIVFELTIEGAKKFAELTRNNIGRQLAITLDGEVQTSPTIKSEIPGGKGTISGGYTIEEAKSLKTLLNAGALPVKAEILETRTVGATLGDESIAQSKQAGIIAIVLVMAFMAIFYKLPGLIADVALTICGIIIFGTLNYFEATLTLPGIAGLILTLGMAVDANVIIFERIKEELRGGNSILKSVENGFKKAYSAILDGNITTLIITAILFSLGTGPVKGFAVTLTIGILASMFTAITATRFMLKTLVLYTDIKNPKFFGVRGK
ncbi:preprotein translocase subunit SecD [Hypnocyclicus thermotrophus]|uniref:Protein translocase subunit SecD n=1 Tax=Hypnocyclicus thermotrophus TaxID=1627895 RepID=A0AA46DYC5_9FUSO|nr:protein translocase subunit SecD [Hypnocyclicus thermotrophus]TDT69215.1 preprotein translocase subunit SecD [Hypnocyclicus thermotrophus]